MVKGSGGAVGLTQNPSAFRKWLLAGPEQARLIEEFEKQFLIERDGEYLHHMHDEEFSTQKNFKTRAFIGGHSYRHGKSLPRSVI